MATGFPPEIFYKLDGFKAAGIKDISRHDFPQLDLIKNLECRGHVEHSSTTTSCDGCPYNGLKE
jgi:hypothetical protein